MKFKRQNNQFLITGMLNEERLFIEKEKQRLNMSISTILRGYIQRAMTEREKQIPRK